MEPDTPEPFRVRLARPDPALHDALAAARQRIRLDLVDAALSLEGGPVRE